MTNGEIILDHAELQAKNRRTMTMSKRTAKLDAFLSFSELEALTNLGIVGAARRERDVIGADEADLAEIERIGKEPGER